MNVRSGNIYLKHSSLRSMGKDGLYGSRTTLGYYSQDNVYVYSLDFSDIVSRPFHDTNRWNGIPVRCLV